MSKQKNSNRLYLKEYIGDFNVKNQNDIYYYFKNTQESRDYIDSNSKKRPILILGCSIAYGYNLEKEQTLQYKLGKLTHRSVYNRAIPSYGIQNAIYMLDNFNFEKEIKDPEYIIFIFINDHYKRLYREVYDVTEPILYLNYSVINGNLVEKKRFKFPYRFAFGRRISNIFTEKKYDISSKELFKDSKIYFTKLKEVANKKFPNSKLVILDYEENDACLNSEIKELSKDNFIVLNCHDLTNEYLYEPKYRFSFDIYHPNELTWDIVAPKLAKKLNL